MGGVGVTSRSPARARAQLLARLQVRRPEIEQATVTRINAISDPGQVPDPTYAESLRAAVTAALDYGFAAIESSEDRAPPVPVALLGQARVAARSGVGLDTVLRRYFAGHTLLGDFLIEEAERGGLFRGATLQSLLRKQAALLDRLTAAVSEEHAREAAGQPDCAEERRAECVQRLLEGEPLDATELNYDLEAHHLGAIASGMEAREALRNLAKTLDCRLMTIPRGEGTVWAWLSGRSKLDLEDFQRLISTGWPPRVSLAIGEPAKGLGGWRLTHRQAAAALSIALRRPGSFVRYADIALLASILRDDLLATSLRQLYLAPLDQERDGGQPARETLRAYFAADRNVSSAAAALGVSRRTVSNRLRAIDDRLARPLNTCATEIEIALRLDELDDIPIASGANCEV